MMNLIVPDLYALSIDIVTSCPQACANGISGHSSPTTTAFYKSFCDVIRSADLFPESSYLQNWQVTIPPSHPNIWITLHASFVHTIASLNLRTNLKYIRMYFNLHFFSSLVPMQRLMLPMKGIILHKSLWGPSWGQRRPQMKCTCPQFFNHSRADRCTLVWLIRRGRGAYLVFRGIP